MISEIIDLINDGFDGMHADEAILGLAQRVYRVSSSGSIEFMPGIVKSDGEAIYAGVDDVKSIMIYHKANTATLTYLPRSGYGDGRQSQDNFACSVICVWDTRKIPLQSIDLLLLLRSRMPQAIKGLGAPIDVTITPSNAVLNTKQIFDSEYTVDKEYLLPIYMSFIQLNYAIQIKYDQQCIEKCINCS